MACCLLYLKLCFLFYTGFINGITLNEKTKLRLSIDIDQLQKDKLGLDSFFHSKNKFKVQTRQDNSKDVVKHAAQSISKKMFQRISILQKLKDSIMLDQGNYEDLKSFEKWSFCCKTDQNKNYIKSSIYSTNFFEKVSLLSLN